MKKIIELLQTLFQKRELGPQIVLVNDIIGVSPLGDKMLIPEGTICENWGIPCPEEEYGKAYVELKLLPPITDGFHVTDRLIVKRNSKDIATCYTT